MALMAEHFRLAALLPDEWERDMTTFLSLSQEVLLSLSEFLHCMQHPRRSDP